MNSALLTRVRKSERRKWPLELLLGLLLTSMIGAGVLASSWLFPIGAETIDLTARLVPPMTLAHHPLGTDPLGRDVLARVAQGGKVSLLVGLTSVLGAVLIGTVLGLLTGYYRGIWDTVVMRLVDVQLAMPFILMALVFVAILGGSLFHTIVLLILSQWVQYARLMRGLVLSLREREFVLAAQSIGAGDLWIMGRHLLPNLFGPMIVLMTINVANNILLESSLTFLGLGVDPLTPSWGGMLADGRTYLQTAWWVTVFPGLAILLTVLGLNLLGDWLRDWLDPMSRTA